MLKVVDWFKAAHTPRASEDSGTVSGFSRDPVDDALCLLAVRRCHACDGWSKPEDNGGGCKTGLVMLAELLGTAKTLNLSTAEDAAGAVAPVEAGVPLGVGIKALFLTRGRGAVFDGTDDSAESI